MSLKELIRKYLQYLTPDTKMFKSIKKVLVVGLGSIGKRHIRIIQKQHPSVEIMVMRHRRCDDLDAEVLGIHRCVTTIDEALDFKPDAAIIANPATKHLEIAKLLASANIHLLIEKPIAESSTGVQSLIDICHDKKNILMTAYNLRFLPSLLEFREQLKLEKIGKILSVRAEVGQYLPDWRSGDDYRKTVSAQKNLGGGVLLELSHEIDYLTWIFGSIKWVKSHVSKQSDLDINVEDTANIIIGFEQLSNHQLTATLNMDFVRHDTTRQCLAIGEKGTLRWDGIVGDVQFYSKDKKEWEVLFSSSPSRNYTYTEEIKHFFSSIELKTSPMISGENGMETILGIEAINKSHKNGSIVYL